MWRPAKTDPEERPRPAAWLWLLGRAYGALRHAAPGLPPVEAGLGTCCAAAAAWLRDSRRAAAALFASPGTGSGGASEGEARFREGAAETQDLLAADPFADPLAAGLEAVRSPSSRRRQGLHLTPEPLADWVVSRAVALRRARGLAPLDTVPVLDPTCGTGTFLLRAARAGARSLWGADIDPLAAQLAAINLLRLAPTGAGLPDARAKGRAAPRVDVAQVSVADAASLAVGDPLGDGSLPPPGLVLGNLPYVRRDRIRGELGATEAALAARWAVMAPELVRQSRAGPRLVALGRADLYALLLFAVGALLPPGGQMAVLTSGAWLDGAYGEGVRRLLTGPLALDAVAESRVERWFGAAINTVLLLATRPESPTPGRAPAGAGPAGRGPATRQAALFETLLHPVAVAGPARDAVQTRRRRVARSALAATAPQGGWSEHLRAPEVYLDLLDAVRIPVLGSLARVFRGVTTLCNRFFYPPPEAGVEPAYLAPVLRSPQGLRRIRVVPAALRDRVFLCDRTEAELRADGAEGTLAWLAQGRRWCPRLVAQGARAARRVAPDGGGPRPWYALRPKRARLTLTKTLHDAHLHRLLSEPTVLDQRFYGLAPAEDLPVTVLAAALQSVVVALSAEVVGSTSLGQGALDLPVRVARSRLRVPDLRQAPPRDRAALEEAFEALCRRPVAAFEKERSQPDRRALDAAVLAGLGLRPEQWLEPLYDALSERMAERLRLARGARIPAATPQRGPASPESSRRTRSR